MLRNLVLLASFAVLTHVPAWAQSSLFEGKPADTSFTFAGDYAAGGASERPKRFYVEPNEINPQEALPIYRSAAEGVYVSVGTERGFLGAASSPAVSHLLLLDLNPDVVFFNQINVLLLKMAKTLPDYLALRTAATPSVWRAALHRLSPEERALMSNELTFKEFSEAHVEATRRLLDGDYFLRTSYLREAALFDKINLMAKNNRIQVLKGNLQDKKWLGRIARELSRKGIPISVLDESNAWSPRYTTAEGVSKLVNALSSAMTPETILLTTDRREVIKDNLYYWDFHGVRYALLRGVESELKTATAMTSFVEWANFKPSGTLLGAGDLTAKDFQSIRQWDLTKNPPSACQKLLRSLRGLFTP